MITLRFEKQLAMRYVSHIDLLRHIERTMRRAGVPVAFSQGFNPHMQLNLGVPLPVGVGSVCEYGEDMPITLLRQKFGRMAEHHLRRLVKQGFLRRRVILKDRATEQTVKLWFA